MREIIYWSAVGVAVVCLAIAATGLVRYRSLARGDALGELLEGVNDRRQEQSRRLRERDPALLMDGRRSLHGWCSYCHRRVDNHDERHRVSALSAGGRGVECVLRGDIEPHEAAPLGRRER